MRHKGIILLAVLLIICSMSACGGAGSGGGPNAAGDAKQGAGSRISCDEALIFTEEPIFTEETKTSRRTRSGVPGKPFLTLFQRAFLAFCRIWGYGKLLETIRFGSKIKT